MVMVILTFLSVLPAIVILYNLTNINVAERIRELSTVKVLGFHNREVTLYIYRKTIVLSFVGIVSGLFSGRSRIKSSWRWSGPITSCLIRACRSESIWFPCRQSSSSSLFWDVSSTVSWDESICWNHWSPLTSSVYRCWKNGTDIFGQITRKQICI